MSSDLLREFGVPETPQTRSESQVVADTENEDEDFGEFEGTREFKKPIVIPRDSFQQREGLTVRAETGAVGRTSALKSREQHPCVTYPEEDYAASDEDDFGEFAGESILFDADQAIAKENDSSERKQPSFKAVRPAKVTLLPIHQQKPIERSARKVSERLGNRHNDSQDEVWEPMDFIQEPTISGNASASTVAKSVPKLEPIQVYDFKGTTSEPPPSNIPPPSVLLPVIARAFLSLPTNIKKIASAQRLSHESFESFNSSRIDQVHAIARAGAHVLAGRKLRWKRDNLLFQSMKIGPAGGKSSGMKLAGVDKGESRREDQESVEVLSAWRKKVGSLRSTIAMVNSQPSEGGLKLPEISENMPIRVVKPSEGAVTAPKACFLCGIRRDERVAKVDVDVEDSFDEWWRENWGHVDCVVLWENQKNSLPQR